MALDTKARILDVAEHLFADHGFQATSLRDITGEAGLNVASVNYHFGSKEALLSAVLQRRLQPVNEERLKRLDRLEQAPGLAPGVEAVLRAFLAPPFEKRHEWGGGGRNFLRLMGRLHSETDAAFRARFLTQFAEVFDRFTKALQRSVPHVPAAILSRRMLFLVGAMAYAMTWADSVPLGDSRVSSSHDDLLEPLVQFGAAGMASPAELPVRARVGVSQGAAV